MDSETHKETYMREESGPVKKRAFIALQRALVKCQEIGDEKLHLLTVMNELIENRTRQLEQDRENLGKMHVVNLIRANLFRKERKLVQLIKSQGFRFFFQDLWAEVIHEAKNGGSFSEMMGSSISN